MLETGYSFSFIARYWWIYLPPLLEWVFFGCVSGFRSKFSRIALLGKGLQLDSKSDLTTEWLILCFFDKKWILSSTLYLFGLISARIVQLFFFSDDIKFFRCLIWGVFWSVLQKSLYFLAIGFCNIDWWALGIQCNLTFYILVSSSLFCWEVLVNFFDDFWKPNCLFSKFCVNCVLISYFVYCNSCALKDVNRACWCIFSLVALRVPNMCFSPAKTRRKPNFFEMHACLWPGAQIWLT